MHLQWLPALLDTQEEESELCLQEEKLHEYLELILKLDLFHMAYTAYLLTPNMLSISSSSGDLKI